MPCAMWRDALRRARACSDGALADGAQVVVAGGPDYYPGSRTASPSFSFAVTGLRVAGEGDLLAQLEALRRSAGGRGPVRAPEAPAPADPAAHDRRRHRRGRQGARRRARRAAPPRLGRARRVGVRAGAGPPRGAARSPSALQDLAAVDEVEVIVVARGGGSLADLFAFCDETLCRTVAMLRVPVIASVGHHTDRTLIDDVAAVRCSTPTHAAETAVPLHCGEARAAVARARRGAWPRHGRRAVARARAPRSRSSRARPPSTSRASARGCTRGCARSARRSARGGRRAARARTAHARGRARAQGRRPPAGPTLAARRAALDALAAALGAHDPERVVARGYAVVDDRDGDVITTAARPAQRRRRAPVLRRRRRGCDHRGR